MRLMILALPLTLMACTQFPELDRAVTANGQNAKYPSLVPVEPLLAQSQFVGPTPEQTIDNLSARVSTLQNRAARLRGPVVDANTRQRMRNGVN